MTPLSGPGSVVPGLRRRTINTMKSPPELLTCCEAASFCRMGKESASGALFEVFMRNVPGVAFIKDTEGRFVYCNEAFGELAGRPAEQCVGLTDACIWPAGDAEQYLRHDREVIETGKAVQVLELNSLGDRTHWLVNKFPILSGDGRVRFVAGIAIDVTEREAADAALAESEARYRRLVDHAQDVIFTINSEGIITSLNPAFERLTGWKREQWVGQPFAPLVYRDDLPLALRLFARAMRGDVPPIYELRMVGAGWAHLHCEISSTAEVKQGEVVGILGIARDVTARRQADETLRQSEQRYELAARATKDLLWDWDLDGGVLYFSGGIHELFLHDRQQVCSSIEWWGQNLHPKDRERVVASLKRAVVGTEDQWAEEYQFRRGDGSYADVFDRGYIARDGQGRAHRMVGTMSDLTERKRAEAIERERNGLKEAVAAMEKVLGVVGHELRTPLAGLRAISELLLTDLVDDAEQSARFLACLNEEVVRMAGTVDDLLEAARLNSGRVRWNWSEVNVRQVCSEALESIRPLMKDAEVALELRIDADATMRGDPDAIRRLVLNLLSNARTHTTKGSIAIHGRRFCDAEGEWLELSVSDTGCGIAPEILPRLGEAFALNAGVVGACHVGGTGLGLAICRGVAAAHAGKWRVESTVGKGTVMTAVLRADLAEPVTQAAAPASVELGEAS